MMVLTGKKVLGAALLLALGASLVATAACATDAATPTEPTDGLRGGSVVNIANSAEVVAASALGGLTAQTALPSGSDFVSYVAVVGSSVLEVAPDKALIALTVEARASEVATATAMAGAMQESVIAAARAISGADDFSSNFSVRQDYVWEPELSRSVPSDFVASYNINFAIVSEDALGELVGEALAAAVNAGGDLLRVNSISFALDDDAALQSQARRGAAENARLRAADYTGALNVELGEVLSVAELNATPPPILRADTIATAEFAAADGAASVPAFSVQAGLITISASVQVTFEIVN